MAELRARLIDRVAMFGVREHKLPGREDGFSGLSYGGKDFAHFHNDHELDIRLGRDVIRREGLTHPPNSVVHPKRAPSSHWIELRFHSTADLDRVVRLVKLAVENL
jgi:hypothetical protein